MHMTDIEKDFDAIYKLHSPKVYRLCMGYAKGDSTQANEWMQDTFVKLWNHRKQFKAESQISTYIYRIALNTCLGSLRISNKRFVTELPIAMEDESTAELGEEDFRNTTILELYDCIDKLSSQNKSLILMELEQISQETIAATAGLKYGTLRTRLNRIKSSLYKCLNHGK